MAEALKDMYNDSFFQQFMEMVKSAYPAFEEKRFLQYVLDDEWQKKELKQRVRHITKGLRETLPHSYKEAITILMELTPHCNGFEYIFFPDYVEVYGQEHWELSILALQKFTASSTSEYAVRPFIMKDQERMLRQMLAWSRSDNHHVRRLASEGCRPRLPWGVALKNIIQDPSPIIPILARLKQDQSLYVRKSVANNLNDISKDHPQLVKDLVKAWKGEDPDTDWILKHGCRTLLKKGDQETLHMFGYTSPKNIYVQNIELSKDSIRIGEELQFCIEVINKAQNPEALRIEYAIDYLKANGNHSRKIFQLAQKVFPTGTIHLKRKQWMKDLSTRKHYEGLHKLTILINGEEKASKSFKLSNN